MNELPKSLGDQRVPLATADITDLRDQAAAPEPAQSETPSSAPSSDALDPQGIFDHRYLLRRLQLPVTLLGAYLPALILWALPSGAPSVDTLTVTLIMLGLSASLSWYILARLREHAKARLLSYVLPVNIVTFGGALSIIALLRLPYSATLFSLGAACAAIVNFLLAVRLRGLMRPHIIVLSGRASEIKMEGQYKVAPKLEDLQVMIESGRRDWALVADLHYPHSAGWEKLFAQAALAGVPVYHFRQVAEMQSGQVKITHLSENDLGSLIPNVQYMSFKRLIDILGALILLPFCLVGFALIGLAIKLDSPGSAFFIQERIGFRSKPFKMIKFRTMRQRDPRTDGEEGREAAMTLDGDDRVTRIGQFLRKSRLDELPQIFNILRGEMSFIGPRPEALALAEWYEAELPFYTYRHVVRPGITGWAQVNQGHVTDVTDVLAKLRYDFYYIKNVSLWLDLLVALKTLRVIATGLGAK